MKMYYRIGEISEILGVKSSTLRSWEKAVPVFKPVKRGGRKFYTRTDLENFSKLKKLILEEKYTIEGARKKLLSGSFEGLRKEALDKLKKELFEIKEILS